METLVIRKIKNGDFEVIKGLWDIHFGSDRSNERAISFKLILEHNPYCKNKDGYYIGEYENQLVAYCGIMPSKFHLMGQDHEGYIYQDSMVDPAYRGKGVATDLCKKMVKELDKFSIAVWMNAPNARVFEKSGWKPVTGMNTFVRVYSSKIIIENKFKYINSFLVKFTDSLISFFYKIEKIKYGSHKKGLFIESIRNFDEQIDFLFHSVKKEFGYIPFRTKEILNWKYSNEYSPNFKKLVCRDNNKILGYIIFKIRTQGNERKLATIYDYLCSPNRKDVFKALFERAIVEIEQEKPDLIKVICSNGNFSSTLKKFGFFKASDNRYTLKYIHENQTHSSNIAKGHSWHFTHGDGDRLFWSL